MCSYGRHETARSERGTNMHAPPPPPSHSSVATEWVKGKTLDEAAGIKNSEIAAHLKLPPVKLHCSMLAESAIKAAIKDYQNKSPSAAAPAAATE